MARRRKYDPHGRNDINNVGVHGSLSGQRQRPRGNHAAPSRSSRTPSHISQVSPSPQPSTQESDEHYERRVGRGSYVEEGMRRRRRKTLAIVIAFVAVVAIAAAAVGVHTYFKSTDARLDVGESNVKEALVEAQEGAPYYALLCADLSDRRHAASHDNDNAFMLARIDETDRKVTFVSFPAKLEIQFPDDHYYPLDGYPEDMGDAGLIKAVSQFAGIGISHFVTTDADKIRSMVELVGDVTLDVTQEIDDPRAGSLVIHVGQRSFTSDDIMVFLRATNFQDGFDVTAKNRVDFTMSLLSKAVSSSAIGLANAVSEASKYINTDWTAQNLLSLGNAMAPIDTLTVYQCVVPSTSTVATTATGGADATLDPISSEWKRLMEVVGEGGDPADADHQIGDVETSKITVEVRNGAGITGAGAALGATLEELGYTVKGIGNTNDDTIYPETLIVYTGDDYEDAAYVIRNDIHAGRVIEGGDFYSSDANVIVIIGTDWAS